jgi:hypothetical protein
MVSRAGGRLSSPVHVGFQYYPWGEECTLGFLSPLLDESMQPHPEAERGNPWCCQVASRLIRCGKLRISAPGTSHRPHSAFPHANPANPDGERRWGCGLGQQAQPLGFGYNGDIRRIPAFFSPSSLG